MVPTVPKSSNLKGILSRIIGDVIGIRDQIVENLDKKGEGADFIYMLGA